MRVRFELLAIAIGVTCLAWTGVRVSRAASFQQEQAALLDRELAGTAPVAEAGDGRLGRLEIPRLNLSVMVMEGDDRATLDLAVGHLRGTALPWQDGNVVLAGHRDTFFRPLKDLRVGDAIRLTSTRGTFAYTVSETRIVRPDEVSVLAPTADSVLTLVTCYPFYYVGPAPQRFIVRAR